MSKGNLKRYIVGSYKDEKGMTILKTELREEKRPCKWCGKNPRQERSSGCKDCSDAYNFDKNRQERLKKKVEDQAKINS